MICIQFSDYGSMKDLKVKNLIYLQGVASKSEAAFELKDDIRVLIDGGLLEPRVHYTNMIEDFKIVTWDSYRITDYGMVWINSKHPEYYKNAFETRKFYDDNAAKHQQQ